MDISQETLRNLDYLREFKKSNRVKPSKIVKGATGLAVPIAVGVSTLPEIVVTGSTVGMAMGLPAALTAYSLIGSLLRPNPEYVSSSYDTLPPTRLDIARAGESDATSIYSRGPVGIPRYLEEEPTLEGEAPEVAPAVEVKSDEGSATLTPTTPLGNPEEEEPENEPKKKGKVRKLIDKVLRRDSITEDTPRETPTNKLGSFAGRIAWETKNNNFGDSWKWRNAGRIPLYWDMVPKVGGYVWDRIMIDPSKGFKKGMKYSKELRGENSTPDKDKTKETNEVDSTGTISRGTTAPLVGNYTIDFDAILNMNRRGLK